MQHVLRTLVIAAAFAVSGVIACAPTEKSPPEGPLTSAPPAGEFKSSVDSSKLIYVTPVEGVTSVARLVLADAIAAALRDAKKPAVLSEKINDMGPTVAGRIVEVQERDSVYWVTASWALKAPYGTPVAEYRQQIVVDKTLWQSGAPEAINLLVADAGPMVAGMVSDYVSPVSLAPMPSPEPAPAPAPEKTAQTAAATTAPPASKPEVEKPAEKPVAETAIAAKEPRIRPKTIPRRPDPPPRRAAVAPKGLTAKQPAKPVETAALETPKPAAKSKPDPKQATGGPTLLTRGPPPRQPREKPVEEPPLTASKSMLMPVPGDGPELVPDPPPVAWSRPSFLIKTVEGAPGDGNLALMRAMKTALRKRDLTVTEDPRQAGFVISGRVQVGPAINGRQQAKIVWAVDTTTGEEVGKAVQENAVAAGSLDGTWGRLAEIVSAAAVAGIRELFGFDEKQSSRADAPPVPPMPNLPRVPGRAPPPPN